MITLVPILTHIANAVAFVVALLLLVGMHELRRRFLRLVERIKNRKP